VPKEAISMSIRQILKSRVIICTVPSPQKAVAVRLSIEGAVTPNVPASILQTHHDTVIYLDRDSAAQLRGHADADA
jgi:glucosamine-6-phosphate deaminase